MKFQRETVLDVCEEIKPLLARHWEEISHYKDIPLDPDWYGYIRIEESGALRVYTARDDENKLVGYAVFFINKHMHSKDSLQAVQDLIFIDSDRRGFGADFIVWIEKQLKVDGAVVIYQHINIGNMRTVDLFRALGYQNINLVLGKRLN